VRTNRIELAAESFAERGYDPRDKRTVRDRARRRDECALRTRALQLVGKRVRDRLAVDDPLLRGPMMGSDENGVRPYFLPQLY
jgi:hypothetical protein